MNRLVRRYTVLFLVILIPLVAAYLVGSYGYNSEKFGQTTWRNEFQIEYLTFEDEYTTEDKIEKFMEYGINNQYFSYDKTPILKREITSEAGDKLFDILVYRMVYEWAIEKQPVDRFQYGFFFYNVQYQNIRDLFDGDESRKEEINKANVPTFVARAIEVLDNEYDEPATKGITQIPENQVGFPDYDSDVKFKSGKKAGDETVTPGDSLVHVYMGFIPMRETQVTTNYTISIKAVINSIVDDTNTSIQVEVANFDLELEVDPEKVDYSNYKKSHMQDLDNAGYFSWVFKNYLWWISAIAFVAVFLITGSFYLVYLSEEKRLMEENKKKRKRK